MVTLIENHPFPWWDYPGLELWKFVNLLIFVLALLYFIKRPLGDAFRGRQETIRRELAEAQKERDEALAKLAAVEERLRGLDSEVVALQERSRIRGQAERERIIRESGKGGEAGTA